VERLFNLCTIFCSLVFFPTFLASITNSVAAFRKTNADYVEAHKNLLRYLRENRISLKLSSNIQSVACAKYRSLQHSKRVHEPDVMLLKLLPRSLLEQMHTEVFLPIITRHPFLQLLGVRHERALIKLCDVAMGQESLDSGGELFAYGKEAGKVNFLVSGRLIYVDSSCKFQQGTEEVHPGTWICDQVLWMPWVYRGQMTADQQCELASIDGASFRKVIGQRPQVRSLCCRFAERYLAAMQAEFKNGTCSDLGFSVRTLEDIALATSAIKSNPCPPTQGQRC